MRWLYALISLFIGLSLMTPEYDAEAAKRRRGPAAAAKQKQGVQARRNRGGRRRNARRRNQGNQNNNAAPAVPAAKGYVAPKFALGGGDHGSTGNIPVERFDDVKGGAINRPVAEVSPIARLKPAVPTEPPANANDPCGIRFAAPGSDDMAIALHSEGFYLDRSSGNCEKGFRGSGGNPFPFRTLEECSRAVAAGGCSQRDSDPPLKRGKLVGQVVKVSGDLMPGSGPRGDLKVEKLATRIHLFQGKITQGDDPFDGVIADRRPLLVVSSDANGQFTANLPPGEYTIFAEVDGKLAHTEGAFPREGHQWGTVQVREGEVTTGNITDQRSITH